METLQEIIGFLLHLDKYLEVFISNYGNWVYILLFAIIFIETGVVIFPFLPGDSLLFIAGALCGSGLLDYSLLLFLLMAAAILGNQTNYTIGKKVGDRVFSWGNSRWFNKDYFDKTHAFYEKYGGVTLVVGRFMPFVRTFAPFVAGVVGMSRKQFTIYDVTGGVVWVGSLLTAGYFFGDLPWVKANLNYIILLLIFAPGGIALWGLYRKR